MSNKKLRKILKTWEKKSVWFTSMHSLLILTIALVFTASLTMGYLVQNYVNMINREFHGIYRDSANFYISAIGEKLSDYQTAMGVVSMSNDLRDNIFRKDVNRSEMVVLGRELRQKISEMTFLLYQSHEVISHRLYTYLPCDGYIFWDISDVENDENFTTLKQGTPQWWYSYSNVTQSYHLTLARVIYNFNSTVGSWGQGYCYQTMEMDTENLFEPKLGLVAKVFLFDNRTGDMIYNNTVTKNDEENNTIASQFQEIYNGNKNFDKFPEKIYINQEGKWVRYSTMARQIASIDATAVMLFNAKQIKVNNGTGIIYGIVLVLICMMLLLIISSWMYNRRLNRLIVRMDRFNEKDIRLPEPIGGLDEIARIDKHLLQMQNRIQILIQEEYTAKMQVMSAHQNALMACINPHFLYNTLNTISAMACVEGADSTVEMVSSLSDMFRYSSDLSKQQVTLREELNNIKDYLYIQSMRYQDAFTYQMDIEESLYNCQVPKLILQPIVENAFKHGFKNQMTQQGGDRQICIRAERSADDLIISVIDNGKGISALQLSSIKEQLTITLSDVTASVMGNGSIGLLNVHHRIRLCYGSKYGLQLMSEGEGAGLTVQVRIPCQQR